MPIQAVNTAIYSTPLKKISFGEEAPKTETKQTQTTALPAKGENPVKQNKVLTKTIASLLMPGLGQLWNNEREKGFTHLVVGLALYTAVKLTPPIKVIGKALAGIFALGNIGFHIYSAIDAQKTAAKNQISADKK